MGVLIENFEDYSIDKMGRVWSFKRNIYLKPGIASGYEFVVLSNKHCVKSKRVHRLVAEAFIPNPENKPCVNHKDSNRSNNAYNNLEWVTHAENTAHAIKSGRMAGMSKQDKIKSMRASGIDEDTVKYALNIS